MLTVGSPSARLPLSVAASADHLELRILTVSNPRAQGFSLRASIQGTSDGPQVQVVLGTVSPFPPDRPATFALPLSEDAERLLDATNHRIEVLVELSAIDPGRPLEPPLEVLVGATSPDR